MCETSSISQLESAGNFIFRFLILNPEGARIYLAVKVII